MPSQKSIITALLIFIVLGILAFGQYGIISLPEIQRVQYTPDDGYYYLTLARNFASSGHWTFDGVNATSGFHLLWAYVLLILSWVSSVADLNFVSVVMIFSAALTLLMIGLMIIDNIKAGNGTFGFLAGILLVSSPWFIWNSISLTEWPLLFLCSYLFFKFWYQSATRPRILFYLAFLGTLTRTEFVLIPFVLALVPLIFNRDKIDVRWAGFAIMGAIMGLLILILHSLIFTGDVLQSSLSMKFYWGRDFRTGSEEQSALALIPRLIGFEDLTLRTLQPILFVILFVASLSIFIARKRFNSWLSLVLITSSILFIAYILLYWWNGSIQMWYTGSLLVPLLFIVFNSIRALIDGFKLFALVPLIIGFVFLIHHNLARWPTEASPYPHQAAMLEAGEYLRNAKLNGKIGSWNAGIIGYYQGGTVTNLDGLTNNSIHPHIISNALPAYLTQERIVYIADFRQMLSEYYRRRGGYNDRQFIESLLPIRIFSRTGQSWDHLTVWKYTSKTIPNP